MTKFFKFSHYLELSTLNHYFPQKTFLTWSLLKVYPRYLRSMTIKKVLHGRIRLIFYEIVNRWLSGLRARYDHVLSARDLLKKYTKDKLSSIQ